MSTPKHSAKTRIFGVLSRRVGAAQTFEYRNILAVMFRYYSGVFMPVFEKREAASRNCLIFIVNYFAKFRDKTAEIMSY